MYRARVKISVPIKEVDRNKKRESIQVTQFVCFILCFWLRLTMYVQCKPWLHVQINWLVPSRIGRTYTSFNFLILIPLSPYSLTFLYDVKFSSYLSHHTLVASLPPPFSPPICELCIDYNAERSKQLNSRYRWYHA